LRYTRRHGAGSSTAGGSRDVVREVQPFSAQKGFAHEKGEASGAGGLRIAYPPVTRDWTERLGVGLNGIQLALGEAEHIRGGSGGSCSSGRSNILLLEGKGGEGIAAAATGCSVRAMGRRGRRVKEGLDIVVFRPDAVHVGEEVSE